MYNFIDAAEFADYGKGSTYFRVVSDNGHPMLVLEVRVTPP
jgi:hypothetical protein